MNKLNKQNFNCSNANVFAAKRTYPTKWIAFFMLICFMVNTGYSRSKKNHVIRDKKFFDTIINYSKTTLPKPGDKNKKIVLDTTECLDIAGQFDCSVKEFTGFYNVKLILENTVVATQTLSIKKGFGFTLLRGNYYTIKIEKEGYIPRIFSVSTKIDNKLDERNVYVFSFETSLLSQDLSGSFEDDNLDFPFALISYNKTCDCFEHSKEYTASLIQRMINDIIYGINR
ncbi:MAG TPA: hypothetical protein VKG26_06310 [Bacteroidia bacterium]|nr:hypothetical protein [Bacteroidia bacterium]